MQQYLIVIEKAGNNYAAYSPDLPGWISTGATVEETRRNAREAMQLHLAGMREHHQPLPEPHTGRGFKVQLMTDPDGIPFIYVPDDKGSGDVVDEQQGEVARVQGEIELYFEPVDEQRQVAHALAAKAAE